MILHYMDTILVSFVFKFNYAIPNICTLFIPMELNIQLSLINEILNIE